MATIDFTSAVARRWAPGGWQPGVFHLYNKMDFSVQNAGSGDTVKCLLIPAGTLVLWVAHIVDTAEGGTSTADIGDGDDTDYYLSTVNNNATAGTATLSRDRVEQAFIDGGAAGNHTVTGITTTDTLTSVLHDSSGGILADLTGEFSISAANTINNGGGTATSSDKLLVTYQRPGSKYYSSEDTIDMTLSANAVDTAVIKMVAACVELGY